MEYKTMMWVFVVICFFILGLWAGFVLHESLMIKGAVAIAEGLEGTTFNINVDVNETEITNAIIEFFNESLEDNK